MCEICNNSGRFGYPRVYNNNNNNNKKLINKVCLLMCLFAVSGAFNAYDGVTVTIAGDTRFSGNSACYGGNQQTVRGYLNANEA